jgi:hypothetical protein
MDPSVAVVIDMTISTKVAKTQVRVVADSIFNRSVSFPY